MIPVQVAPSGSLATVEQDTLDEVTQSVQMLLGCRQGTRTVVPTYGVEDLTFRDIDPTWIDAAVAQWEPRAAVTVSASPTDQGVTTINVAVALASGGPT
jgi:phage baseplate assembly protein W